jgi:hypothetical protein
MSADDTCGGTRQTVLNGAGASPIIDVGLIAAIDQKRDGA